MIPGDALDQEEDAVVKEARAAAAVKTEKEGTCSEPKCERDAEVKGKCKPCYARAYYRLTHPKKEEKVKAVEVTQEDFDYHGDGIFTSKVQEKDKPKEDTVEKQEEEKKEEVAQEPVEEIETCDELNAEGIADCTEPIKARGKCQNHYRTWIRNHPELVKKQKRDPARRRTQLNFHYGDKDNEAKELISELETIAKHEMRRTTQQALYFLREGIDRWKAQHEDK